MGRGHGIVGGVLELWGAQRDPINWGGVPELWGAQRDPIKWGGVLELFWGGEGSRSCEALRGGTP